MPAPRKYRLQALLDIRERAKEFEDDPDLVHSILQEGAEKARDAARETLEDVRAAIGIGHR